MTQVAGIVIVPVRLEQPLINLLTLITSRVLGNEMKVMPEQFSKAPR